MKKTIICFTLCICVSKSAFSETFKINQSLSVEGELVYASPICTIIESKDPYQLPVFLIVSEIATAYLPEISREICLIVVGRENQEICNILYEGIEFASGLRDVGSNVFKLSRVAAELYVERNKTKAVFRFTSHSLELAYNIKNTIEAYEKLKLILWSSSDNFSNYNQTGNYDGVITINNRSSEDVTAEISRDGITWQAITFMQGRQNSLRYRYANSQESYILWRGLKCDYQIYAGKAYKITYFNNQFYINDD